MAPDHQERVLVLAPTAADAAITESILVEAALCCHLCQDTAELVRELHHGAGAILMTEEMLALNDTAHLAAELRSQPAWSDVPVLLLCGSRAGTPISTLAMDQLGNVTVLERPVRLTNLVSALRSAIRARRRQYQIRDQLVALQLAEERLREADRRKDEFLAILAHELRNPLAPARNAAHYMKLYGPPHPDQRRAIEMIERQIAQMARLIDDLLDVSRISRGLLELRQDRFEFGEIAEAAVEACRHDVQARRHTLRVNLPQEPVVLEADRDRLVQVLSNLLTNASKYTPAGGQIELTGRARNDSLEVSVKDNGIGIPPEKLTEIFELFAQVDRSFDRQGGLGIGLTLVRQLVELHGGTIEARSEGIGQGSEFVLVLPIAAAVPAASSPARRESPPAGAPLRILAADDNRDAAESLALLLELSGHEICVAYDGEAAVVAAAEFRPDVALLDIAMPKRDGYDVARHIRAQPWGKRVFMVALTGWGQEGDRQRAREAGFDAHLVKPVAHEELNELLLSAASRPA